MLPNISILHGIFTDLVGDTDGVWNGVIISKQIHVVNIGWLKAHCEKFTKLWLLCENCLRIVKSSARIFCPYYKD